MGHQYIVSVKAKIQNNKLIEYKDRYSISCNQPPEKQDNVDNPACCQLEDGEKPKPNKINPGNLKLFCI